ncbi:hypothetical protein PPERSA_11936 [Pseudocohnilembus persalinus]|uniref:Uncharacterized protein n=1 Tax=Pseudocohnilembus persalinus TaxID=266149 RepID=A0A0V0QK94_PSEPJ|nr:hypothetical protein PPERSA_11936 [Pseudocohnilembus persalinus]|eukprot:KRX02596.1 hypothetical protein PPERSA_11936 [Pseudocohnilembus persalinus]
MENIQNLEGLKQALDIMRNGVLLITQENTSSTIKVNKQKKNPEKSTILKFTGQFDENQMTSSKKYQQLKNCQKTSILQATNQYSENNSNQKLENFNQKISNKMTNIDQNDIFSCNKKQKTASQQKKQNQQKNLIQEKPIENQLQFPFANQEFQRYFNLTKEDIQNDNNIVLQVLRKCQILEITTQTNLNLNMHFKSKKGTLRSNNQENEIYNQNLEQYIIQYFKKIKKNYEILKQKTIDKIPGQKQHKHTKVNQNEQGQQITSVQNSLEQNKAKDFNENICENNQNNNINFNNDNSDSKLCLEDEQLLLNEQKNYNRIQRILVSFQDDGLDQEIIFEVKLDFYRSSFQNKETLILAFIDQSEYLDAHNNYLQNKQKDEVNFNQFLNKFIQRYRIMQYDQAYFLY